MLHRREEKRKREQIRKTVMTTTTSSTLFIPDHQRQQRLSKVTRGTSGLQTLTLMQNQVA